MANITESAEVKVNVNGQEAIDKIKQLKKKAVELRDAMTQAVINDNTSEYRRLAKNLKNVETEIRHMQASVHNVDDALRHLSTSTPKELKRTQARNQQPARQRTQKRLANESQPV